MDPYSDDEDESSSDKRRRSRSRSPERSKSPSSKKRAESSADRGRKKAREEVIELCPRELVLAGQYVEIRRGSKDKKFQWDKLGKVSRQEASRIRKYVRQNKLLPQVTYVPNTLFPIFPPETIAAEIQLPKHLWGAGDTEQFEWLDAEYEKGMKEKPPKYKPKGDKAYTWHHHHEDGKMQMVEYGTHNSNKHEGGRVTWAEGKR